MRKIYLCSFLLISIFLLLVACANNKNMDESYVSEEILLPKELKELEDVCIMKEDVVRVAGFSNTNYGKVWESNNNGQNWKEIKTFIKDIDIQSKKNIHTEKCVFLSPNGEIFYNLSQYKHSKLIKSKNYIIKEGKKSELMINLPNTQTYNNTVYDVKFLQNGNLIVRDITGKLYQINRENGNIICEYISEDGNTYMTDFTICGNKIYTLDSISNKIHAFSVSTAKVLNLEPLVKKFSDAINNEGNFEFDRQRMCAYVDKETGQLTILYIDKFGLRRIAESKQECLIEGKNMCLADNDVNIYSLEMSKKGFYLIARSTKGSKLYFYTKQN
ncbi:hypothetical protein NE619_17425 [Anaerovorax odorimutans]|uniref:Lipoprotein n=1 Tax=Anaerovorax odorimutans TaxID=109327 RepID=A0ABT1RTG9_9FIRM|nr:hypothetical protein [Anaerovorax odorimutans]MCQ4638512.1 hypothetical protein [Anaerovorax odorimutans]